MAAVDFVKGFVGVAVSGWVCTGCKVPVAYLNQRQFAEWKAMQAAKRQNPDTDLFVECRGFLFGRRACRGHLVRAEAVRS